MFPKTKTKESMFWELWCSKTNGFCWLCKSKTKESMILDLWSWKTNGFLMVQMKNQKSQCFWTSDAPTPMISHCFAKIKQKSQFLLLDLWCSKTKVFSRCCKNKTKESLFLELWCSKTIGVFHVVQDKNKRVTVCQPLMLQNPWVVCLCFASKKQTSNGFWTSDFRKPITFQCVARNKLKSHCF